MAHATTYSDPALAEFLRHRRMRAQESNKKSIGMGTMKSSESAELLAQFDAAIGRLELLARLSPLQQQFLALVLCIDPATEAASAKREKPAPLMRILGSQAEEITRLANHPLMSRPEKTKAILKINTLDQEGAALFIEALRQRGRELDGEVTISGPTQVQVVVQPSQHPALQASSYDLAREAYLTALQLPGIGEEERRVALGRIDLWNEEELRTRTAAATRTAADRQVQQTQVA